MNHANTTCINLIVKPVFPGVTDMMVGPMRSENQWFINQSFCCNDFECNRYMLPKNSAIQCYVCDSRITGLEGCSILNTSSPHVYKSGTSNPSEQCAVSSLMEIKCHIFIQRKRVFFKDNCWFGRARYNNQEKLFSFYHTNIYFRMCQSIAWHCFVWWYYFSRSYILLSNEVLSRRT